MANGIFSKKSIPYWLGGTAAALAVGAYFFPRSASGTPGPQGPAGADGSEWFTGSGVPSVGTGVNGDFYLDSNNGDYYSKSGGVWVLQGNLEGPQGPPGMGGGSAQNIVGYNAVGAPGTPIQIPLPGSGGTSTLILETIVDASDTDPVLHVDANGWFWPDDSNARTVLIDLRIGNDPVALMNPIFNSMVVGQEATDITPYSLSASLADMDVDFSQVIYVAITVFQVIGDSQGVIQLEQLNVTYNRI